MKIAEVYLRQRNQRIDKPYHYLVPDTTQIGQRVNVPFGVKNKIQEGIIINFSDKSDFSNLKTIDSLVDEIPKISKEQIELAQYLKGETFGLFYPILSNFTSAIKTRRGKNGKFSSFEPKEDYLIELIKKEKVRGTIQKNILETLTEKPLKFSELKEKVPKANLKTLKRLSDLGLIKYSTVKLEEPKNVFKVEKEVLKEFIKINELSSFIEILKPILLNEKGQTLILFPNNYLARQFHFYLNNCGITNSLYNPEFSKEENYEFYMNIRNGKNKVIISNFNGIFLNYQNLQNIIVTFVGDSYYGTNQVHHFNVIEVCEKLAELHHADLYLIDFVDSIISNYNIENKNWKESNHSDLLPDYHINTDYIDLNDKNSPIFSESLKENLFDNFKNKKKTLLVLNRKGYFNYYFCSKCHKPLKCPRCGSILRGIKSDKEVECRVCGFTGKFPDECAYCGNKEFNKLQFGIEKVLEEAKKLIPEAKVVPYFKEFQGDLNTADIIVATSQILYTKKVENIATIGAVLVDIDLNFPDYQAPESAFRFYSDLFNRYNDANIIVQTQYYKNSFLNALNNDPNLFLEEQKQYRELAEVPPFSDLYMITLMAPNKEIVNKDISYLQEQLSKVPGVKILKPHVLRGIKGVSQRRFLVKDKNSSLKKFFSLLFQDGKIGNLDSKVSILVNPSNIL